MGSGEDRYLSMQGRRVASRKRSTRSRVSPPEAGVMLWEGVVRRRGEIKKKYYRVAAVKDSLGAEGRVPFK